MTLIFRWITTLALLRWVLGLAYGIGAALLLVVLRFGARIGRIGLAHKTLPDVAGQYKPVPKDLVASCRKGRGQFSKGQNPKPRNDSEAVISTLGDVKLARLGRKAESPDLVEGRSPPP